MVQFKQSHCMPKLSLLLLLLTYSTVATCQAAFLPWQNPRVVLPSTRHKSISLIKQHIIVSSYKSIGNPWSTSKKLKFANNYKKPRNRARGLYFALRHKRKKHDSIFKIKPLQKPFIMGKDTGFKPYLDVSGFDTSKDYFESINYGILFWKRGPPCLVSGELGLE